MKIKAEENLGLTLQSMQQGTDIYYKTVTYIYPQIRFAAPAPTSFLRNLENYPTFFDLSTSTVPFNVD